MKNNITAVVITKNEEKMLLQCLNTLKWVNELIVVDTGSTDKTVKIAKKFGARVIGYLAGKNFSDWRNKGLKEAKGEWLLYIDADERVTQALREEVIEKCQMEKGYSAYAIPRINVVLGKELKHGGWYPDYQKRLFLKENLKNWKGELHEEPEFQGELSHLKNPMLHLKHESFAEMVEKTNLWSETEAKLMYEAHHPMMNIPRFISAMCREFWQRMVVKRAFLDGKIGVMFALYQVFSRFISYAKLWEMQIKK